MANVNNKEGLEALKIIEKYRAMNPKQRQKFGNQIVDKKLKAEQELASLNGREGTLAGVKRNALVKKLNIYSQAISGMSQIKYEDVKSKGSLDDYTM